MLYLDTDVLLLQDAAVLWRQFGNLNASQIAAMSRFSESGTDHWYANGAKHPYIQPYGWLCVMLLIVDSFNNIVAVASAEISHDRKMLFTFPLIFRCKFWSAPAEPEQTS